MGKTVLLSYSGPVRARSGGVRVLSVPGPGIESNWGVRLGCISSRALSAGRGRACPALRPQAPLGALGLRRRTPIAPRPLSPPGSPS